MSATADKSTSSSQSMRKRLRKATEEKEEAELEAAANYSYEKENGIAAQNRLLSPLLSLPQDVTYLLLEYVTPEPEAILSLRQVCTVTKGWVDSLSTSRSQSRRIFSKIPIYLNLNYNDLEKFDSTPPPPSTCALKLTVEVSNRITEHMELMKTLRIVFPSFFGFWRNQMVSLYVENYSSRLLDTLGPPKTLRELYCAREMTETHPSLLQLETIEYNNEPSSIKFFRHIARSRRLKRLSVKIRMYKTRDEISNSKPFDQLERLQIVLDAKRNDKDFHLDIQIESEASVEFEDDKLRHFISSFGASASSIRMFNVPNGFPEQVLMLDHPTIDDRVTKKLFNSFHSYEQTGDLYDISCLTMERHLFENLKTLWMFIPKENEDEFTRSEDLKFPSGIQSMDVVSGKAGCLVPKNIPGSLRSLALTSIWSPDRSTTAIELVESLSLISQSCPFLEELTFEADIVVPSSGFQLTNTLEETNYYAFKKLRSLKFYGKICGDTEQRSEDGGRRLSEILLFDILRVDQMSLLKLSIEFCSGNQLELDSGCVERLLKSPLASSLIQLTLNCKIKDEAKESFKKVLQAIVERNDH